MRRSLVYATVTSLVLLALTGARSMLWPNQPAALPVVAVAAYAPTVAASEGPVVASGRVEPISEEIEVGTELSGKISAILVQEGDHVQPGQALATFANEDYAAQVAAAEARLAHAEAERRRVLNGARRQERREAWAVVEQTVAVMQNAALEVERRQQLFQRGYLAREEAERADRDLRVARARSQEARERYALLAAEAREEDRARAQAVVALARAQLNEARARLAKTIIRAPITGVVLRQLKRVGESVSPEVPNTVLFIVADTRTLRVRVDVDETDVGKIHLGQRSYMTAAAYPGRKFWGRVVRIGQVLGKKNVRTDAPTERVDTKVLETLVELDSNQSLPLGLRVDAVILMDNSPLLPREQVASNAPDHS